MSDDSFELVPKARLQELLAIEAAYTEEHAAEAQPPTLADRFSAFRASVARKDRERRGE